MATHHSHTKTALPATFYSAYPTPFLRPMWPFLAGGSLTLFGIWKIQNAALACELVPRLEGA